MELDTTILLEDFPQFELSYELITHKKVFDAHLTMAIPKGHKCFAWFTSYKEDNVCAILTLDNNKQIVHCKSVITTFNDSLSLGTILYGTCFKSNDVNCFCVEDIYYFKGKKCLNMNYLDKLHQLKSLLKDHLSQCALTNEYTIFGLPYITNNYDLLVGADLPYEVDYVLFRYFNRKKILKMEQNRQNNNQKQYINQGQGHGQKINNEHKQIDKNSSSKIEVKQKNVELVFKIVPELEPDIYSLLVYHDGKEVFYDNAFIPDYKTSVMMNKLFRNVKENDNLDAIEESDDEDDFQDISDDKYVKLDKSYKMKCVFIKRFKKWCPVSLASDNDKIISLNVLKNK